MRIRSPPEEPPVQVLGITQDGEPPAGAGPGSRAPGWPILAVVAALVAGLGYGFMLGRGDRPAGKAEDSTLTTSTTAPAVTTLPVGDFQTDPVRFRRSVPGHDLGRGVTEYLNPNLFRTIAVDENGMVWAGGPAGVARLDPVTGEFDRFTDSDGTGPLDVRDLGTGSDGSVHAATGRGMSHWDGVEWASDSVVNQETSEWGQLMPEVGPLAVASDGTIWLVTHAWSGWDATSYIHRGSAPFYGDVPTTALDGYVHDVEVGQDGTAWVLGDEALWRYDGTRWTKASLYGWMSAMAVDTHGDVWVGRDQEIVRVADEDGAAPLVIPWAEALGLDAAERPPEGFIRLMAAGPDGSVWALADVWAPGPLADWDESENTLIRIDDGAASFEAMPGLPAGAFPEDMAVAPDGELWIATNEALMRFDGSGWSTFSIQDQPPIDDVQSMTVGPAGDLWIAGGAGLTRFTSHGWHAFDRAQLTGESDGESQLDGDVWVTSGREHVWAGIGCRVFEYGGMQWDPLPSLPEEPIECWHVITASRSGDSLWLAVMHMGSTRIYRWSDGEWSMLGQAGLEVTGMDVAPDGAVWLAGWEGLGRFQDGEWSPIVTGQGFEHVAVASDGTVWASAPDWGTSSGIWKYDEGAWEIEQDEPFESATVALVRHPDGYVVTLERNSGGRIEAGGHFVTKVGELHSVAVGHDGTIWVAGEGRLYRLAPPGEPDLTVMDWRIDLDEAGPGVHTVHMIVDAGPLGPERVAEPSGTLVWDETVVDLCGIRIRGEQGGRLVIGDIFQTTEGCGTNPTAMQDAFDEFGLPEEACVVIDLEGRTQPLSHCGPLLQGRGATP